MSQTPRILVFSGSARRDSYNQGLSRQAAALLNQSGAQATWVNLGGLDIPLYHGDLETEHGLPLGVKTLRSLLFTHDALVIASPEYNGFPSPLLKNALDWASRRQGDEPPRAAFLGKSAYLLSATRGESGGGRGLRHLAQLLTNLKVQVLPDTFTLPRAESALDAEGNLLDPTRRAALHAGLLQLRDAVLAGAPLATAA
ncbi:NADPH-dependent FMN reductase [Chitinimonas sp. BJYL2]|uniref:NADPH-dependent FMN reductase n=1 Tax=Chitinimonas sp. BJYL2 TaxID=2976696 RepID=UPI0022B4B125|nr:NAD(P)H-dependent oxidoreductase [Chitinimonas sp. BJYL2]